MKFIPAQDGQVLHRLELTRRNLEILLAKLDDPLSQRQLLDPGLHVVVEAKEHGDEHGEVVGTSLIGGGVDSQQCIEVVPVENVEHYADRAPGAMYMPSTGETL